MTNKVKSTSPEYRRSRSAEAKKQGICTMCCCRPASQGFATCKVCRDHSGQRISKFRDYYRNVILPPRPIVCPICESIPTMFYWHHWNDGIHELGMWVCPYCNLIVELEDRGLVDKYRELKRNITYNYGVKMLDSISGSMDNV